MIDPANPTVRIGRRAVAQNPVIGPGRRAVVWIQGCRRRCPGCMSPELFDFGAGVSFDAAALAAWIVAQPDIEGVTFTGGEPFDQAAAVAAVCTRVRADGHLGIIAYTGNTLETLQKRGTPAQRALLANIDLLIDGPYEQDGHADLLWRGSRNQRFWPLTPRYRALVAALTPASDRSAGTERGFAADGEVVIIGVPTQNDAGVAVVNRGDAGAHRPQ